MTDVVPGGMGGSAEIGVEGGVLELVWPVTYMAALGVIAVAWYFRILDLGIGPAVWLLAGGTGLHLLVGPAIAKTVGAQAQDLTLLALHVLSLVILGVVWVVSGALEVPSFLVFYAAPVAAAAIAFGVWARLQALAATLITIVCAALLSSPPLRWYGGQLGVPLGWLERLTAWMPARETALAQSAAPLPAIMTLSIAMTALIAVSIWATVFAGAADRILGRLHGVVSALRQVEGLALELLRSSPLPEAVVLSDSAQIILVNDRFRAAFVQGDEKVEGASLFDILKLKFPEALESRLRAGDGSVDCIYQTPDGRSNSAHVYLRHSQHEGAPVTRVTIEDYGQQRLLEVAIDALDEVILVVGSDGAIVHANNQARVVFPAAQNGAEVGEALRRSDLPDFWWRTAPGTAAPRQLQMAGTTLRGQVACRTADGHSEPLTVITLRREPRS